MGIPTACAAGAGTRAPPMTAASTATAASGNKAAYLIAEGGRFNGRSVKGIGRTRTARVYYQALTTRLTPAANYVDLGDALLACLHGPRGHVRLPAGPLRRGARAARAPRRSTSRRGEPRHGRGPAMRCRPKPGRRLLRRPRGPAGQAAGLTSDCSARSAAGTTRRTPTTTPTGTARGHPAGATTSTRRTGAVVRTPSCACAPARRLPERAYLRFEHGYSFDADWRRRYDGGVVEIKVGGGRWRGVASLFTHGGYSGRIARGTGNPLAGQRAFTANSRGWSSARVNLADIRRQGHQGALPHGL